MNTPEIINFLTREQTRQKITDVQMCKSVGMHKTTLWRIKTGVTAVTNTQIVEIAKTLGYEIILQQISK